MSDRMERNFQALSAIPKDELIRMFLMETLYNFLLKNGFAKKGEVNSYSKLLGITAQDLESYCNRCGYPGVDLPAHQIKTKPIGGEAETEWTLESGVFTVWYTERNTSTWVFRTESKKEFENYWIKENMEAWQKRLNKLRVF